MKISKEKIYIQLAKKGMKIRDLAEKYGCTRASIYSTLKPGRNVQPETVHKISEALNCEVIDILEN